MEVNVWSLKWARKPSNAKTKHKQTHFLNLIQLCVTFLLQTNPQSLKL